LADNIYNDGIMLHIYKDLINQMLKKKVIYNIFLDFLPKFNLLKIICE